jgi:hypothetical protein
MEGNLNNIHCQCSKHGIGTDIFAVEHIDYVQVDPGGWNSSARQVTVILLDDAEVEGMLASLGE